MTDGRGAAGLGPMGGTPVVADRLVVVGTQEGVVIAFGAATGAEQWRRSIGTEVDGPRTALDGVILAGSRDGLIHRLATGDGLSSASWPRTPQAASSR